jgi:DNA-directed RNA polymerase specialized sigma subunit
MTREILQAISEDPKGFMLQGRNIKAVIAAKRARIEEWRKIATDISVTLKEDGGAGPSGYKQSTVENAVCNIVDLENEIIAEIENLANIERIIAEAIRVLLTDDRHKVILEMRYVNHFKLEEIALRLNYAFRWVQRLNGQALVEMKEAALRRVDLAL